MADLTNQMKAGQTDVDIPDSPARILIVDDDTSILKLLELTLATNGFEVTTAENGARAVPVVDNADPFDLVFLDMMMPEMDGYDFLCWFRKKNPNTPVVVFTSLIIRDITEKLNSAGATEIQRKPVSFETILALAHNMTSNRTQEI